MTGNRTERNDEPLSLEFKIEAVQLANDSDNSLTQLARELGIPSRDVAYPSAQQAGSTQWSTQSPPSHTATRRRAVQSVKSRC